MGYTVFLAEDDLRLRGELSALLERYGYRCLFPASYEDLAGQILSSGAQLVLLDLGLPRYDGYHVCRDLRARSAQLPIMIVTSRSDELDELMSMNLGADDFITKPFNPQILLARMARLLQRAYPSGGGASVLSAGGMSLDLGSGTVRFGEKEARLTRNEVLLLRQLLRQPGQIVSRDALMNALWQSDQFVDDNTLTVNVTRLRRTLEERGLKDVLITRRGQGYQLLLS